MYTENSAQDKVQALNTAKVHNKISSFTSYYSKTRHHVEDSKMFLMSDIDILFNCYAYKNSQTNLIISFEGNAQF